MSMAQAQKKQTSVYKFDGLVLWKTRLPNAKHAVLPPQNNRPNPFVTQEVVYASVFSEGAICALERRSGKLLWRKEIPKFGGSAVYLAHGKLFAKTANTLFALEPETGKTIWSFVRMAREEKQSTLILPSLDIVFLSGDRQGYLHCLDLQTGRMNWQN
jgi:outer membrane protein assembly factor BamB